ncbi:MAG: ATP-binding protein [Phenylobacterium sp.]|uniref:sensor histidine kinase n=1 Tax=Phenylobacterium sp. TaxID=1871053 RepID=UPI00355FCB3E
MDTAEAGLGRQAGGDGLAAGPVAPQSFVRLLILSALLLLSLYTVFAIWRLSSSPPVSPSAAALVQRANELAARADVEAMALQGGALAAVEVLQRAPNAPLDAAEAALRTASGAAVGAVVVSEGQLAAAAGKASGVRWSDVVRAAEAGGQETAFTVSGARPTLIAIVAAPTPQGRRWIGLAGDPDRLAGLLARGKGEAFAGRSGTFVAAAAETAAAADVAAAFGRPMKDLGAAGPLRGARPDGTPLDLAARPAAGGALIAVVSARAAPGGDAVMREQIAWLLLPLVAAFALGVLLLRQSRKAEEAQRAFLENEQRFRLAVEAARCGIWEWDIRSDKMFMSDVTGAIFGWGGGGVVDGADVIERVSSEHRDRLRNALNTAAVYGAFDVSFRVPGPHGGRPIWIDARGQAFGHTENDTYARIIGVALDVTEERMAQARAQAAENRLRDAIESVSEAFVLWDRHGRLLMCNRNYRAFFNIEPKILKPGARRDEVNRFAALAVKQQQPAPDGRRGVREAELNDGRWIQISERRTAEGGLVMTAADITAIKTQEAQRRLNEEQLQAAVVKLERSQEQLSELARKYEAEKLRAEAANKSKSEFLANMSHELRTPLNAINGFSEIMVSEMFGPLGDPRYKEYAQDILASGQHLLALINDILDMSKIEAGKMNLKFEPIALEEVVEDAARLIRNRADAAGLSLTLDLPELPEIEADYRAVKQVLLNLLSNAVKFTPRGGKITVNAEIRRDHFGERVKVAVADTGIGIEAHDLARLATPFEQIESQHAKTQQGTGLGLALTKSLVEMHSGSLDIRSKPGEGTTVSFVLPVTQSAPSSADVEAVA